MIIPSRLSQCFSLDCIRLHMIGSMTLNTSTLIHASKITRAEISISEESFLLSGTRVEDLFNIYEESWVSRFFCVLQKVVLPTRSPENRDKKRNIPCWVNVFVPNVYPNSPQNMK
jgi:hypothetical protein